MPASPLPGETTPPSRWSLMVVALRYRDFRLVWLGSVTEHTGEFMELAAVLWLTNQLTHSPLMLTVVGTAHYVAMIFFPIAGGVVADRINRRHLLIMALLASCLLSVALMVLTITGVIAVWHLAVISLLHGVAISFNHPARQSIVPNLVKREHLLNAISIDVLSVRGSSAIGMTAAGYLIAAVGTWPVFALRALGCLVAIDWLAQAHIPPTPPATRTQAPLQNLAEGFRYLRSHTAVLILVLMFALPYLLLNTYTNFIPVFASDILRVGAIGYGWLQGAPGIGGIICLVGLGLLTYYQNKFRLLIMAGVILGIGMVLFAVSPWLPLSLPLLVVVGGMNAAMIAVNSTIIQSAIPDEVRGRILSWRGIFFGLGPTVSLAFGALAQQSGVVLSLVLLGGISLVISLALIRLLPRFNNMD
ncbi:MAG: MFS transporter [Chloroflexota bacterium]